MYVQAVVSRRQSSLRTEVFDVTNDRFETEISSALIDLIGIPDHGYWANFVLTIYGNERDSENGWREIASVNISGGTNSAGVIEITRELVKRCTQLAENQS